MNRTVSVAAKLEQIEGLRGTNDLSAWEDGFVESVYDAYVRAGRKTSGLTDERVRKIEQIWGKHFA